MPGADLGAPRRGRGPGAEGDLVAELGKRRDDETSRVAVVDLPEKLDGVRRRLRAVEHVHASVLEVVQHSCELDGLRVEAVHGRRDVVRARGRRERVPRLGSRCRVRDVPARDTGKRLERAARSHELRASGGLVGRSSAADEPEQGHDGADGEREPHDGHGHHQPALLPSGARRRGGALLGRFHTRLLGHAAGEGSSSPRSARVA